MSVSIAGILRSLHSKDKSRNIDVETLLAHSISPRAERIELYKNPDKVLAKQTIQRFNKYLKQYRCDYPLAYIVGHREFMSLDFVTKPGVLIPRPETEFVVEAALVALKTVARPVVMDIGTGSGNIAVSIAKHINNPAIKIYASDISARALVIAGQNSRNHKVSKFITFCRGNLFEAFRKHRLEGKVDMIVSNPPYVARSEARLLMPSVRRYEPKQALFAIDSGLSFYKEIIASAPKYLKPGGRVILEMGHNKLRHIQKLVVKSGYFGSIKTIQDYNGIERVIVTKYIGHSI
ncbi:MAG: peptide chain release factor N(5)-glutamine methyltransferase [Candidatus Brocadiia bacterium]